MTKCDFCPNSVPSNDGKLICKCQALWRCEEAIEKMMKYIELEAKANSTRTEKRKKE